MPFLTENLAETYIKTNITADKFSQNFLDNYNNLSTNHELIQILEPAELLDGEPWGFIFTKDQAHQSGYHPASILKRQYINNKTTKRSAHNHIELSGVYLSIYTKHQVNSIQKSLQKLLKFSEQNHININQNNLYILVWKDEIETPHIDEQILEISFKVKKDVN